MRAASDAAVIRHLSLLRGLYRCISLASIFSCSQGYYSFSTLPLLSRNKVAYAAKPTVMLHRWTLTTAEGNEKRESKPMASKLSSVDGPKPSLNLLSSFVGKSTSTLVSLLCFAILAYKRNATMLSFFLGSIVNAVTAKVLKRVIKQQRPETADTNDGKIRPSDNGMPSSHSMSLGFIGTYTYLGWGKNHMIVAPTLIAYIALSLYYRIQAKLHTKEQVYVGVFFGAINGYLWHQFTFGRWPFSKKLNSIISNTILPASGILPAQYLVFPAVVGLAVVGSFERRISRWIKRRSAQKEA